MNNRVKGFALAAVLFCLSTPAYAYLDPGTGSIILQGLIAGVAALGTVVSINYHRLKAKVRGIFGGAEDDKSAR